MEVTYTQRFPIAGPHLFILSKIQSVPAYLKSLSGSYLADVESIEAIGRTVIRRDWLDGRRGLLRWRALDGRPVADDAEVL